MADKVILPVEVAGLAQAKAAVEDIFRSSAVTAAQVQKQQEALSRQFKEKLRGEKITRGQFQTTVKFPEIAEGEDVIMKLSADMGEDVREFLQKSRNAILRGAREGTPEATRQALQSMKMLSKDVAEAFNLGQITQPFVDRIENDIVSLEKQQRSDMRTTENRIRNDVKTFYDGRRRAVNEAFKGAKGDISALQKVLDEQRQLVSELDTVTRAGILGTNQRLQQARSEMRRTGEALRSATMGQMTRSERFAIMTPEERMLEMDRRRAVHQRALARREGIRRQREQAISQSTLGAASVGIGLFGQAGFPLLNVGFAAMSGPGIGAMAALATAAGESARALERFRVNLLTSAEQLHFVTRGFKDTRAELQAVKAFFGGLASIGEQQVLQERLDAMLNNRGTLSVGTAMTQSFSGAFRNIPTNIMSGNFRALRTGNFIGGAMRNAVTALEQFPEKLTEMRDSMERNLLQFSSRFESGEEMFRRISQAAASRSDDSQRRLIRKQIEMIDALIENTKQQKENTKVYATEGEAFRAFLGEIIGNETVQGVIKGAARAPFTFGF